MTITRLFQSGFESGSKDEFDDPAIAWGITASNVRTGTYAGGVAVTVPNRYIRKDVTGSLQQRCGFNIYMDLPTNECEILTVRHSGGELFNINYNPTGELELEVNGTRQDITTTGPLTDDAHHLIGVDFKINATTGWIYVYLNANPTAVLSFTGNTGSNNAERYDFGTYVDAGNVGAWTFDDIFIDDTVGEGSAALPPFLRFYPLTLNGNGNYNEWVGSDGNSVDNYLLIDERGPSDSDYLESDAAAEDDSWAMSNITLEAQQTIQAVIPLIRAQRFGSSETLKIGTRLSATDLLGSEQSPQFGDYDYLWERQTTKPGGGAWTESDVNSAEALVQSAGTF